jgi:ATP-dependent helicase/nuclease subunit B
MPHDSTPRLYTIPSGTPFLDALARTLMADPSLGGKLGINIALADLTILLPTRRAVRALGDAFLRIGEGRALLLPDIRPLGDVDEDELALHARSSTGNARFLTGKARSLDGIARIPQAIEPLERQLRLARLILDLGEEDGDNDICRATALAADLATFLDMVETERVDLTGLSDLVPDEFAENWQLTIEFLKLLTARWPAELERLGLVDPATRRNLLLDAETAQLAGDIPKNPIIAAGSTGSIPATAALLEQISRLPNGAVVLPGLDLMLDEDSFLAAPHSHPQYGMKQLIAKMGVARADVSLWPAYEISSRQEARSAFLSQALRPAETTERWHAALPGLKKRADESLQHLFLCELETTRAESETIAVAMREVLETEGKTAALVTPDRALARRVAMDLRRWNIEIDDSGGLPLAQTPPVAFLRLVADMVADDFHPVPLLACLKHPLAALGGDTVRLRSDVRKLETTLLRGPAPAPGIDGLRHTLAHARKLDVNIVKVISRLIDALDVATKSFCQLMENGETSFAALLQAHITCAEALANRGADNDTLGLWAREEGDAAAQFVSELIAAAPALGDIDTGAYGQLFTDLGATRVLRPRFGRHPRLFIWGPLEARLQHADRMILGGLNEGTWPTETKIDPWLNRPMRKTLGLEPPERRIGLAAHDFVEGASAGEVILTRALKIDGAPTVASRWLLRLQGLARGMESEQRFAAPHWAQWADGLDQPNGPPQAIVGPTPRPPVSERPSELRVTEIETLIRDPYAIYARHVLKLEPLEDIDVDIAAAERGTIIHDALERFATAYPDKLPADALAEVLRIGRETFADTIDRPAVATFWWPRFERIAEWFVAFETDHRKGTKRAHGEASGRIKIEGLPRDIFLRGRADRIDVMKDGSLTIIDYKTGYVPGVKEVEQGLAPQLPLEAAMAARGAFEGIGKAEAGALLFLRLTGADQKPGEIRSIPVAGLAEETWESLVTLLKQYEKHETPYLSNPRPQFLGRFANYDHLARVKEWSTTGGGGE